MRQQSQRGFVQLAIAAHRIAGNLRIAGQRGSGKPASLNLTRGDHAPANACGTLAGVVSHHVVEGYARDVDLQIDSVEQRAR
jgi:hypothetical protein